MNNAFGNENSFHELKIILKEYLLKKRREFNLNIALLCFQVKKGVLAFAYTKGNPPSVFEFDSAKLEYYWKEWLKRLAKYHMMHSKTV